MRDRVDIGLRFLEDRQDPFGVLDEALGGGREPHAPADPLEQLHADLTRERGHLLGDGGGGHVERLGGTSDGASGRDLSQYPHAVQVEH